MNPEPWPSPHLFRPPASKGVGYCGTLTASVRVKDTALTLPTQPRREGLPGPGPSSLTSLPRGPSPQISPLPAEGLGWRSTTPSQLKVPEPSSGLAAAQKARVPSQPTALPGCPSPAPLRAGRRRRALRIPHAPQPFAGSHKGPVSWRRSAGNQPGPWPAAPLPIQLAPAPPQLPLQPLGRVGKGAQGPWYRPSSSRGRVGVARVQHSGRRPLAQRPLISIYPPPPTTGATCFTFLDVWERAEA